MIIVNDNMPIAFIKIKREEFDRQRKPYSILYMRLER